MDVSGVGGRGTLNDSQSKHHDPLGMEAASHRT